MKNTRAIDRRPIILGWLYALGIMVATLTAALPAHAQNAQQSKMGMCNHMAAGKTGAERKAFMSQCLSNKPAAPAMSRQDTMRSCNRQATGMKGDARKAFMKRCLSN